MKYIYISHGASLNDPDWFIVEPRENPDKQVRSLRESGRTVYRLRARPFRPRLRWYLKRQNRQQARDRGRYRRYGNK